MPAHKRLTDEQIDALMIEFRAKRVRVPDFCAEKGIAVPTFKRWRKEWQVNTEKREMDARLALLPEKPLAWLPPENLSGRKESPPSRDGPGSVPVPPANRRWMTVTTDDLIGGDFNPGTVNFSAMLQGSVPVLAVVKKWGSVLTRINEQLAELPEEVRATLPVLVIDDEADQASINTGGNRTPISLFETDLEDDEDEEPEVNANEGTPPSVINGLIRQLVDKFDRSAYVGYTATPFANILIASNAVDTQAGEDLYPRDFFVDLPKPVGYFGPEEIFGSIDPDTGEASPGMDIIREVTQADLSFLIPHAADGAR